MTWTFLTNHARVLVCLARNPGTRLRDVADCADITERAAHRIVDELVEGGYVTRHRLGRRSFYEIHPDVPLRHPMDKEATVGDVLNVFLKRADIEGEEGTGEASAA